MENKNKKGHEACSGCGICLLVCPVWRRTRSMRYTRKARARAIQGGATIEDIASSVDACLLCGSCEPACPEGIGIATLNIGQRRKLNSVRTKHPSWYPVKEGKAPEGKASQNAQVVLLAGEVLGSDSETCAAAIELLGGDKKVALIVNDGRDISRAYEAGLPVSQEDIDNFVSALQNSRTIVSADGLLLRPLRKWLPKRRVLGLGEALMSDSSIRSKLGPDDLYVIESRAYNSDYERLVRFYDHLRHETGCQMNLDLQRIAIPTGASSLQARNDIEAAGCLDHAVWILKGRKVKRIVVEDLADKEVFQRVTDIPVIHITRLLR